jgi:hypothetical protein
MIKKKISIIVLFLLYTSTCLAEGQYGLARFMNFIQLLFICFWIFTFTMIGGAIVKFVLQKNKLLIKNQTFKAFSISFVITILAMLFLFETFPFS